MKLNTIVSSAVLLSFLFFSCKKKDNDVADCIGGQGANLTVVASPTHHGGYAKALKAFIKFNALDYAGTDSSGYDLTVEGDPATNKFYFNDLNCGNYYVYAVTLDTTSLDTLRGGIPIQPTLNEGEFDIIIHVSE